MKVLELWRFPVKSMGGEALSSASVTATGIEGDRAWGVRDLATGNVLTARRAPELLFASARLEGDELVIKLPDGTETVDDSALSRWLEREVELAAAGEQGGTYEVPLDFENDADWVSWQGPPLAWHDSTHARVSLVSIETLGSWDRRRFRANVIVDGGGENELVGSRIQLGSARLDVNKQIDRCVMVTRPQPGLERDLDVLRTINRERASGLAVGCLVVQPGHVSVGDGIVPG